MTESASPAAVATQPLNVQPWPPGSSMLQVAVAPHAAAGPYPTAMRPATAEEAAAIASRFGGAAAAAGVPTGWKLVPVEPTDDMVRAAVHLDLSYMPGHEGPDRACIYKAMLAASPVAPVGAPCNHNWMMDAPGEFYCLNCGAKGRNTPTGIAETVAPVGAPTRLTDERIAELSLLFTGLEPLSDFDYIGFARAVLAIAPGCELATDATKQLGEHSVHLAADDVDQDFRRRPASSEAAPSAEGSITVAGLATAADRKALPIMRALNVFGGDVTLNQPLDLALIGAALCNAGCRLEQQNQEPHCRVQSHPLTDEQRKSLSCPGVDFIPGAPGDEPAAKESHVLPCEVKVGGNTFRKGVSLDIFVRAAQRWHLAAYPDWYKLTEEQKAANLAMLQGANIYE